MPADEAAASCCFPSGVAAADFQNLPISEGHPETLGTQDRGTGCERWPLQQLGF